MSDALSRAAALWAGFPLFFKVVFPIAVAVSLTDLLLKRLAPKSKAYAAFRHGLEAVGAFWTAVILSIVYFLSVSMANAFLRVTSQDPLDRQLLPEPTFWRRHEPNPLGAMAAARHQF